jgi:hypothetical protein
MGMWKLKEKIGKVDLECRGDRQYGRFVEILASKQESLWGSNSRIVLSHSISVAWDRSCNKRLQQTAATVECVTTNLQGMTNARPLCVDLRWEI